MQETSQTTQTAEETETDTLEEQSTEEERVSERADYVGFQDLNLRKCQIQINCLAGHHTHKSLFKTWYKGPRTNGELIARCCTALKRHTIFLADEKEIGMDVYDRGDGLWGKRLRGTEV